MCRKAVSSWDQAEPWNAAVDVTSRLWHSAPLCDTWGNIIKFLTSNTLIWSEASSAALMFALSLTAGENEQLFGGSKGTEQ